MEMRLRRADLKRLIEAGEHGEIVVDSAETETGEVIAIDPVRLTMADLYVTEESAKRLRDALTD